MRHVCVNMSGSLHRMQEALEKAHFEWFSLKSYSFVALPLHQQTKGEILINFCKYSICVTSIGVPC